MWLRLQQVPWHLWSRLILLVLLADQAQRPIDFLAIQTSDTLTLTLIGLLFAPIPTKKET